MSQEVINDVYKKIEREKAIIQGAKAVRASSGNVSVQQKCDSNIREAQNNITYLEDKLRQLRGRQQANTTIIPVPPDSNALHHQHNVSSSSTLSNSSSKSSSDSSPDNNRRFSGNAFEQTDLIPPRVANKGN